MTLQARAEATRRTILAAAVDVIEEVGYLNTSLTEVIDRAGVTKGAFYYHFPTRESLAVALSDAADDVIATTVVEAMAPGRGSTLESLIRAAFLVADIAHRDPRVRIGIQLRQAMGPVGRDAAERQCRQRARIIQAVEAGVTEGDLRADVRAEDVGHTLWVAMLGSQCCDLTAATAVRESLACVLRTVLHGACAPESARFFEHFVTRVARQQTVSG